MEEDNSSSKGAVLTGVECVLLGMAWKGEK